MIVTFYSYKGGTGRTMAAANIACLLARAGRRVLLVDFDLEAPGVWRYFEEFQRGLDRRPGLIELLAEQAAPSMGYDGYPSYQSYRRESPDWRRYLTAVRIGTATVTLLTSGEQTDAYPARVLGFDWADFFAIQEGGAFFERLREEWNREFDFVLIDSRTGITDTGGICTIALPDLIVPVFTANWQNLEGIADMLGRAQRGRQELGYDRPPALVLPVLSRFESRTELESANEWLSRAASMLGECYADWLPKDIDPRLVLERTKLPHVAYFGFGERLAVQLQGTSDPESLGYAYNTVARLIDGRLQDAPEVILGTGEPPGPAAEVRPLEPPTDSWIAAVYDYNNALLGTGVVLDGKRVLVPTRVLERAQTTRLRITLPRSDLAGTRGRAYTGLVPRLDQAARVLGAPGLSVVSLDEEFPAEVSGAPLGFPRNKDLVSRSWWAFGYSGDAMFGAAAEGTVGAALAYGAIRLDGGRRSFWQPEVIGAPVWSPHHGAVVAIVMSVHDDGYGAAVMLADIAAALPGERLAELAVPGTGAGLDSQRRAQFIDALAKLFDNGDIVRAVIGELGLPDRVARDFAAYSAPRLYWAQVVTELENGIIPDGVSSLARKAAEVYPGNRGLREIAGYLDPGG